jgi:Ni/Co efflux regulator RcnB
MNRLLTFGMALALSFGVPTMADAQHRNDDHHDGKHDGDHDRGRGPPDREEHSGRYYAPRYEPPQGYEQHAWHRGEIMPRHHYVDRYVVVEYRNYGLQEPPHGYRWVRVDNDMVLVAIASGVIADVLLNVLYN